MRAHELGPDEVSSDCDCPPGFCQTDEEEAFFDDAERIIHVIMGGDFIDEEPAGLSRSEQLDQLGEIVQGVTNLASLYAAMVDEDRG